MSKIEKALEKFQKESKKSTGQAPAPIPANEDADNSSLRSAAKDDTVKGYLTIYDSKFLPDSKGTGHDSRIMSAMGKKENKNNAFSHSVLEHDIHDDPTIDNGMVSPARETGLDQGKAEGAAQSGTIEPYDVEEHIVSYYDSIKKQTWQGPVMVHFRRLQVSLTNMQRNNMCKVMLFTSSTQNEGKSLISLNTAITLCGDKKSKIVIVDCDFRKPTISTYLGFSPETGLSDYLAGETRMKDISINGLVPGLTVIPVGKKPSNICEQLASDRMKQFLSDLRNRFDYVIIDTPPVLAFPDTAILAPLSDGVVFVINFKKAKKTIVKRAVEALHDCRIMGFVMNRSEVAADDYYGNTYGYNRYDYAAS